MQLRQRNKRHSFSQVIEKKSSSILVNTARGPCVDFETLLNALNRNEIKGATLDVLTEEPTDPSSQLLQLGDKVLLSITLHGNSMQWRWAPTGNTFG